MYEGYCGSGTSCADCEKRCRIDEMIPCSPDCKNLDGDKILIQECLDDGCDEVFYVLGVPPSENRAEKEERVKYLLTEYGETATYPYSI